MPKGKRVTGIEMAGAAAKSLYKNRGKVNHVLGRNAPKEKNSTLHLKMGRPVPKRKGNHSPRKDPPKKGKTARGTKSDGTSGEQSFYSKADGKPLKKSLANVYKILSANTAKNWYECNSCNPLWGSNGNGFHVLQAVQNAAQMPLTLPIDIWDLTAVPNIVNNVVTIPQNRWQMQMSNETASAVVSTVNGGVQVPLFLQNSVGTTTNNDSYPESSDLWVSTQIKLNLVGALTVPVTFHVYLVQFKKDYLCPDVIQTLSNSAQSNPSTAQYLAEATAFWQAMAKPLMFNPILVQSSNHMKDVKVIKHDVFHLEPKLSTEPTANEGTAVAWPHVKTVSYFERMNRKLDYKWNDTGTVALSDINQTMVDAGDTRATVEPSKRVYMILACEAFETNQTTAFSNVRNGSYDIMMKHRHEKVL